MVPDQELELLGFLSRKFRPLSRFEGAPRAPNSLSGPVPPPVPRALAVPPDRRPRPLPPPARRMVVTPLPARGVGSRLLRTAQRTRASSSIVDVFVISKLRRANGECLGDYYRRRTWVAAKSHGELPTELRPVDVRMGKPGTRRGVSLPPEHIGRVEGTG